MRRLVPTLVVGLTLVAAMNAAPAATRSARLVIDLKIEGQERVVKGPLGETSSGTISESMRLVATLQTDGKLATTNSNAGKYRNAAQAQPSSREVSATRRNEIRQALSACKGDPQCVGRVSSQYFGGGGGGATPAGRTEEAGGEPRYLAYRGSQGCALQLAVRVLNAREGVYEDLQRSIPFREKTQADYQASAGDKLAMCGRLNDLALDTKQNKIHVTLGEPSIPGNLVHVEDRSPPLRNEMNRQLRLQAEAMNWAREQLQGAARSGEAKGSVQLGNRPHQSGTRSGTLNLTLTWRFEDN